MDPDFYTEDLEFYSDGCSNENDPFDDIDQPLESDEFDADIEKDIKESLYTEADQIALAMGFGEFIVNDKKVYDIDENTDRENWEGAIKLCSLQKEKEHDQDKFEQYINGITSGQRKGPWAL